jgi:TetR/AcrR family transcriptional regulator, cholesterol catabolism regulator
MNGENTILPGSRPGLTLKTPAMSTQVGDQSKLRNGRVRIAKAALPLFISYGYHTTTVRSIAKAAGISVGAVFNYFDAKDDILRYILDDSQDQIEQTVSAVEQQIEADAANHGPTEIFLKVFRSYGEMIDQSRQFTRLAYQETNTLTPDQRRPLFERDQRILELLKRSAQPAIRSGDFAPASLELKLISLMHLCQAWAIRRWILSEYSTIEEYLDDLEPLALGIMRSARKSSKPTRPPKAPKRGHARLRPRA